MKNEKVLIISIVHNDYRSLGCISLTVFLNDRNIECNLLFIPKEDEYDMLLVKEFIVSKNYNIIGISVWTALFDFAKKLTKDIKMYSPNCHIIWGGIHPTLMPTECLSYADSICIGEGETTLFSLVEKVSTGQEITKIPGIGSKSDDGQFTINSPPPSYK